MTDHIVRAGVASGSGAVNVVPEPGPANDPHPCAASVPPYHESTGIRHNYSQGECQDCGHICQHDGPEGFDVEVKGFDGIVSTCRRCGGDCDHGTTSVDGGMVVCDICTESLYNLERSDLDPNIP